MWEVAKRKIVFDRSLFPSALRFEDDNTTLVYATRDGQVIYESVMTGKELRRVQAGTGGQLATFTPDGKQLLQVSADRIGVRRLEDGALQATILPSLGPYGTDWTVISADGHYVGSPNAHKYLRHVIRTKKGTRILTPFEFRNEFDWNNDLSKVRLK